MIADRDRRIIEEMAAKYHAKRVVLFGSCLSSQGESRDIDIGVEGIAEEDFFPSTASFCVPYRSRSMSLIYPQKAVL
jgi:predicted nucleotidyltransferase